MGVTVLTNLTGGGRDGRGRQHGQANHRQSANALL